jgi:predicted transposase YdaD
VESFDDSLKYLLQQEPAAFIRFGLGDVSVKVANSLPSSLPSRRRDVDGSYLIEYEGTLMVVHIEFHRRHQSLEELAIDVAEAQVRLYRRERLPVLSLVWDLYGHPDEPLLQDRTLEIGALRGRPGSRCVYLRVNLRGLGWQELLTHGPPALWALAPLTRDGANIEVVRRVRDAIEGRTELSAMQRADHLAVLSFVAEAEGVPVQAMRDYITQEKLMASTLYQEILAKGREQGREQGLEQGEARTKQETIIHILTHRLGALEPTARERIRALEDLETLTSWYQEALLVVEAEGARKLAEKILKAPLM